MTDTSYDPAGYGSAFAPVYDFMYPADDHVERLVEVISGHAGSGPVAEGDAEHGPDRDRLEDEHEVLDRQAHDPLLRALEELDEGHGAGNHVHPPEG